MNSITSTIVRYKTSLMLLGIMLLGAALRFADIGTESLWVDEIYSFRQAIKSVEQIIANAPADVHPPVYYVLLHFWALFFGTTEVGLRSLSAVFGVAALPLMYVLGREMYSQRVGLYAALLLALSHFHIHYSQEARNYAYAVLVVILGMIGFVRYVKQFDSQSVPVLSWKLLAFFLLGNTLILYSHFFALFVIAAQNVLVLSFALVRRDVFRRMWKSWLALQSLLLLLFVPWMEILYLQIRAVKSGFWIDPPNLMTLAETIIEYAGSLSAAVVILPLSVLVVVYVRKRLVTIQDDNAQDKPESVFIAHVQFDYRLALLLLWLVLPIMIPFIRSLYSTPIYYVKYTIPALPALLLLVAKGLDVFDTEVRWMRWIVGGIIVALCCIALRDNRNDWNSLEKEVWKESTRFLNSTAARNDAIFVHEWYCKYNCEYYNQRPDLTFQALPPERFAVTPTTIERFYVPLAAGRDRIWLVLSHRSGQTPMILARIERDFVMTLDTIFPSRYRKYMIADTFPQQTKGIYLMKTYLSNDIRVMRFERKK
jgi:mannosyltransferase